MRICSFTDYLLLKAIQRRIGAKTIRSKSNINWQHKKKMKSVKEQIRYIRLIRVRVTTESFFSNTDL